MDTKEEVICAVLIGQGRSQSTGQQTKPNNFLAVLELSAVKGRGIVQEVESLQLFLKSECRKGL